ncbi:hypothetical protein [Amycolatopsis sp. CA-230715]|uniref:hypothetical protein n=1 Tax=Amycolatopsis sp. CA-230715 TaxID=2745196 RepID=UPI001C024C52|nr:hypothetical protein [Amycolatopsis sp. CA-230715]QWF83367.1 hypothetical protein HUW46_06807 [Amycolatopsis sp. CA-230715]
MGWSFDRVGWRAWSGLGAGLLALASTFLPWTVLTADTRELDDALAAQAHSDVVRTAWHSDFFSWCPPILLLLIGAVMVAFGQSSRARAAGLPQLWLVGAAVSLLLAVLGWSLIELQFGDDERELFRVAGVSINGGFGRYVSMLAVIAAVVFPVWDILAARAERRAAAGRKRRR